MAKEKFRDPEVGGRIKEIRERFLGWTREQLGEALRDCPRLTGKAYSYDAVRRWEEDGRLPDAAIIREVARLANVSSDYILGMPGGRPWCEDLLADLQGLVSKYSSARSLSREHAILKEVVEHGVSTEGNRNISSGTIKNSDAQAEMPVEKGSAKSSPKSGHKDNQE